MSLRAWTAAAIGLLSASGHALAAEWLCIPDLATGFVFEQGRWQTTSFRTQGKTIVVVEVPPYDFAGRLVGVEVTHTGDSFPYHRCPPLPADAPHVTCGGLGVGFLFNAETLRYQENYGLGFVDGGDSPDNTPSIEIGRCSRLPARD